MLPKKFSLFFLFILLILTACKPKEVNNVPDQVFSSYETAAFLGQLPENYMGSEPNSPNLNAMINWLSSKGYDAEGFSNFVQANATEISYVGINTEISLTSLLSYFTISGGERPDDFSVDKFQENYHETVGEETFISREQKELGGREVEVLLYEFSQGTTSYMNSFYFIDMEAENQLWKFEFVAPKPDYDEKVAEFDQIVADFKPRTGQ